MKKWLIAAISLILILATAGYFILNQKGTGIENEPANIEGTSLENESLLAEEATDPAKSQEEAETTSIKDYVQIEDVIQYSNEIKENKNWVNKSEEDLEVVVTYVSAKMIYSDQSAKAEGWQYPIDTLKSGRGDCQDWALTFVSLARASNSTIDCYLAGGNFRNTFLVGPAGNVALNMGDDCGANYKDHIAAFCIVPRGDVTLYYWFRPKSKGGGAMMKGYQANKGEIEEILISELRANWWYADYDFLYTKDTITYVFNDRMEKTFSSNDEFYSWLNSFNK